MIAAQPVTSEVLLAGVDSSSGDVERWENEGGAPRMRSGGDVSLSIRLSRLRTQLLSKYGGSDV